MITGFLSFDKDRQGDKTGSARIRVYNLLKYNPNFKEWTVGEKYDAVVFQKYYWTEYAAEFPGIKILDVCDPDWLTGATSAPVVEMLQYVDGVVANTEATAAYMRKLTTKPVIVIADRHDMAVFKEQKQHAGRAKSVIWFGYSHNASVLVPYIMKLQEHGLKLTIMAEKFVSAAGRFHPDFKDQESFVQWPSSISEVNKEMIKHDFALLPTRRRPQEQYKSNNKVTHAWAVGLPVAEWGDEIDKFMDPVARIQDQGEHFELAREDYDCKRSVEQMERFILELKNGRDNKTAA